MSDRLFHFLTAVLNGTAPMECAIWVWMLLAIMVFGLARKILSSTRDSNTY